MELQRIVQEMRPIVYEAGKIALNLFRTISPERKPDTSFVTDADREVEHFVRREIEERYPDYGIFGEEAGHNKKQKAERVWAIDPIDGTAPFVYEFPIWAISVGLVDKQGPLIGFIYLPVLDEMYWGYRGGGSYCNNHRMWVHEPIKMEETTAIIAPSSNLVEYTKFHYPGRTFAFGSAAASLCLAAKGKVQGALIDRVRLYDIAAGACLVQEAGGVLRYLSGKKVNLWKLRDGKLMPESFCAGHTKNVEQLCRHIHEQS